MHGIIFASETCRDSKYYFKLFNENKRAVSNTPIRVKYSFMYIKSTAHFLKSH